MGKVDVNKRCCATCSKWNGKAKIRNGIAEFDDVEKKCNNNIWNMRKGNETCNRWCASTAVLEEVSKKREKGKKQNTKSGSGIGILILIAIIVLIISKCGSSSDKTKNSQIETTATNETQQNNEAAADIVYAECDGVQYPSGKFSVSNDAGEINDISFEITNTNDTDPQFLSLTIKITAENREEAFWFAAEYYDEAGNLLGHDTIFSDALFLAAPKGTTKLVFTDADFK